MPRPSAHEIECATLGAHDVPLWGIHVAGRRQLGLDQLDADALTLMADAEEAEALAEVERGS